MERQQLSEDKIFKNLSDKEILCFLLQREYVKLYQEYREFSKMQFEREQAFCMAEAVVDKIVGEVGKLPQDLNNMRMGALAALTESHKELLVMKKTKELLQNRIWREFENDLRDDKKYDIHIPELTLCSADGDKTYHIPKELMIAKIDITFTPSNGQESATIFFNNGLVCRCNEQNEEPDSYHYTIPNKEVEHFQSLSKTVEIDEPDELDDLDISIYP